MKGWKTWAAGGLSILYGVAGLVLGMHSADEMIKFVVVGLGIVGIGHKIEKSGG